MKNITLSADEHLIEAARERARSQHSTLNEEFRRWLAHYAAADDGLHHYDAVMAQLRGRVRVGRKLSRDEMNER
jgi:hypothetical protein